MTKEKRSKVRYAVIGAGNITQVAMLPAFEHATENSQLVALISGDEEKRSELTKKYDIPLAGKYEDMERLLDEGDIDAVYIATPNSLHREHAIRAAKAGVHVLCEKPLAPSVRECEEIAKACSDARVKLMVAYRLHFEGGTISALDLIRQKKLGDVLTFDSVFGHKVRPDDIRMKPELGGGACLDLGVYCINMARHTFAAEPLSVSAFVTEKNGVDDTTTAILRFEGGRVAQFTVSNTFASTSSYRIAGTEGNLRVEPAFDYASGLEHYLTIDDDTKHRAFEKRDHFAPQLVYFSDCVLGDRDPGPDGAEGVADVRVVEAILQAAKTDRAVSLEPRAYVYAPGREQEQKKPAVDKPSTVNAPSPSEK
jgi:predicted dehydrogenase